MTKAAHGRLTRADIRREVADAQRRSNLRSVAIAANVARCASEARRARVMEQLREFMALTEREPSEDERQRAREVLAVAPGARQRQLFQGKS